MICQRIQNMSNKNIKTILFIFFVFAFYMNNYPVLSAANNTYNVNLNIEKSTAIKIAEAVFLQLYGETVLTQHPWIVRETDSTFEISGTLHRKHSKIGEIVVLVGGVAKMTINKADGRILKSTHGK